MIHHVLDIYQICRVITGRWRSFTLHLPPPGHWSAQSLFEKDSEGRSLITHDLVMVIGREEWFFESAFPDCSTYVTKTVCSPLLATRCAPIWLYIRFLYLSSFSLHSSQHTGRYSAALSTVQMYTAVRCIATAYTTVHILYKSYGGKQFKLFILCRVVWSHLLEFNLKYI